MGSSGAGLFCVEAILVFSLRVQVNAKEGQNVYIKESAFLRVWLKEHKMKYISTYKNESSWAGVLGLEIELGLALTGQFN